MSLSSPGRLRSILGVGFGLAGAVGGTIGAGILRTPPLVAAELPTPQLVLEAVLVALVALVALVWPLSLLVRQLAPPTADSV
jgi:basic amino acid/polyamine antiporter, APA family